MNNPFTQKIKLATAEEVAAIADKSDITPRTLVVKCGDTMAVVRDATELDPVHFGENSSMNERLLFLYALENQMIGKGVTEYYFNVHDTPEFDKFKQLIAKLGAECISPTPVLRYKKVLV